MPGGGSDSSPDGRHLQFAEVRTTELSLTTGWFVYDIGKHSIIGQFL
jgi:hypothetical protein